MTTVVNNYLFRLHENNSFLQLSSPGPFGFSQHLHCQPTQRLRIQMSPPEFLVSQKTGNTNATVDKTLI